MTSGATLPGSRGWNSVYWSGSSGGSSVPWVMVINRVVPDGATQFALTP